MEKEIYLQGEALSFFSPATVCFLSGFGFIWSLLSDNIDWRSPDLSLLL